MIITDIIISVIVIITM